MIVWIDLEDELYPVWHEQCEAQGASPYNGKRRLDPEAGAHRSSLSAAGVSLSNATEPMATPARRTKAAVKKV